MKRFILILCLCLFMAQGAFAIGENDDLNALNVTGNAGIAVAECLRWQS